MADSRRSFHIQGVDGRTAIVPGRNAFGLRIRLPWLGEPAEIPPQRREKWQRVPQVPLTRPPGDLCDLRRVQAWTNPPETVLPPLRPRVLCAEELDGIESIVPRVRLCYVSPRFRNPSDCRAEVPQRVVHQVHDVVYLPAYDVTFTIEKAGRCEVHEVKQALDKHHAWRQLREQLDEDREFVIRGRTVVARVRSGCRVLAVSAHSLGIRPFFWYNTTRTDSFARQKRERVLSADAFRELYNNSKIGSLVRSVAAARWARRGFAYQRALAWTPSGKGEATWVWGDLEARLWEWVWLSSEGTVEWGHLWREAGAILRDELNGRIVKGEPRVRWSALRAA